MITGARLNIVNTKLRSGSPFPQPHKYFGFFKDMPRKRPEKRKPAMVPRKDLRGTGRR